MNLKEIINPNIQGRRKDEKKSKENRGNFRNTR